MTQVRPLRDVFDELAGEQPAGAGPAADPAVVLAGSGHGELPEQLVAEAIVSYADTAPVEVAAHLAPFVTAHSAVPLDDPAVALPDPASGLDLLVTAPASLAADHAIPAEELAGADAPFPAPEATGAGESPPGAEYGTDFGAGDISGGDPFGLDFGGGESLPDAREPMADEGEPGEAEPGELMAGRPDPLYQDDYEPERDLTDGFAAPAELPEPGELGESPADPDGGLAG
jgi:hypothetical protein